MHALDDLGRERMFVFQFAALDRGDIAHGADQMLVHRVVVIHVELHQADGMSEGWHEAAQHARFIHPTQGAFRIALGRQDFEEQAIGLLDRRAICR